MSARAYPWGIDKKLLLSMVLLAFFAGCDAGEKIQEVVDDTKEFINNDTKMVTDGIEGNTNQDIQDLLFAHNQARVDVDIDSNLTWSQTIAKDAQSYADEMANNGIWGHDTIKNQNDGYGNGNYGENLFTSSNKSTFKRASQEWIAEKDFYTLGEVVESGEVDLTCVEGEQCGHYTQIVWKNTSLVGCAFSQYKVDVMIDGTNAKGWHITVCKYQTPGNFIGQTPY